MTLGFGKSMSFDDDKVVPPGHTMTFKDAIHTVFVRYYFGDRSPRLGEAINKPHAQVLRRVRNLQVSQPHSKFNC